MATIASKNPFDLLDDDGPDTSQRPAAQKVEKSQSKSTNNQRSTGRTAPALDSSARAGTTRSRNDVVTGNEAAFRDRGAGAERNRTRDTEPRGEGHGRGRGGRGRGRGARGGAALDDRHSKTGINDHDKQVGRGWGEATGDGEWADEQAGEAIAKAETTEDVLSPDGPAEPTEPVEEEPKTKSYDDYLAEQAEKRLQVSSDSSVRRPNEGTSKKLPTGKEYTRENEEDFIAGAGGKKARDRGKKERNVLELDGEAMRQTERTSGERRGGRGGRGGQRGDFEGRGRGRGRGEGGRGRGGEHRGRGDGQSRGRGGYRGGAGYAPNVSDQSAFPTLGA